MLQLRQDVECGEVGATDKHGVGLRMVGRAHMFEHGFFWNACDVDVLVHAAAADAKPAGAERFYAVLGEEGDFMLVEGVVVGRRQRNLARAQCAQRVHDGRRGGHRRHAAQLAHARGQFVQWRDHGARGAAVGDNINRGRRQCGNGRCNVAIERRLCVRAIRPGMQHHARDMDADALGRHARPLGFIDSVGGRHDQSDLGAPAVGPVIRILHDLKASAASAYFLSKALTSSKPISAEKSLNG